ncbi:unnamed protein product [Schistosoma mattheei]|uniref:Uncharacterized protein n=1 Tax=Schistosoma mattheei TaxID=31246 RepID=A0AA85C066_9TREM|nr:unnamed protein product [Schistosoma mattheei]
MISFIITLFLLIQSCNSGSSSSKCKKEQRSFGKFWSILETLIGFICTLNGIWNTVEHWLGAIRNVTNISQVQR